MRCPICGARTHGTCVACLYGLDDEAGRQALIARLGGPGNYWDDEEEEAQQQAAQAALDLLLADNLDTLEDDGSSGERLRAHHAPENGRGSERKELPR